jgi:hypothetical protein
VHADDWMRVTRFTLRIELMTERAYTAYLLWVWVQLGVKMLLGAFPENQAEYFDDIQKLLVAILDFTLTRDHFWGNFVYSFQTLKGHMKKLLDDFFSI